MREVMFRGEGFELPLLQSQVMPRGFLHGFTTRQGGVSRPPYDSLNLGGRWGDDAAAIAENRRRFRIAAGGGPVHFARQVHGRDVVRVAAHATPDQIAEVAADAVVTGAPVTAVGVYVADCAPILIADARTGACAAVHAGWRGTVAGVVAAAVHALIESFGSRAVDLRVAIGPTIGPCCFEVGPEVVAQVEAAFPRARAAGAIVARQPREHVDLPALNRAAALGAGVAAEAVEVAGMCTRCDETRFYSYRREGGRTGQLAGFVRFEPDDARPPGSG